MLEGRILSFHLLEKWDGDITSQDYQEKNETKAPSKLESVIPMGIITLVWTRLPSVGWDKFLAKCGRI